MSDQIWRTNIGMFIEKVYFNSFEEISDASVYTLLMLLLILLKDLLFYILKIDSEEVSGDMGSAYIRG